MQMRFFGLILFMIASAASASKGLTDEDVINRLMYDLSAPEGELAAMHLYVSNTPYETMAYRQAQAAGEDPTEYMAQRRDFVMQEMGNYRSLERFAAPLKVQVQGVDPANSTLVLSTIMNPMISMSRTWPMDTHGPMPEAWIKTLNVAFPGQYNFGLPLTANEVKTMQNALSSKAELPTLEAEAEFVLSGCWFDEVNSKTLSDLFIPGVKKLTCKGHMLGMAMVSLERLADISVEVANSLAGQEGRLLPLPNTSK